jgi:hypothetical protein
MGNDEKPRVRSRSCEDEHGPKEHWTAERRSRAKPYPMERASEAPAPEKPAGSGADEEDEQESSERPPDR